MGGWPFNQQLKSFSRQSTWELGWELLRVCIVLPRKLTWVPPQKIGLFKKESHLPNLELLKFQPLGVFFWECFFKKLLYQKLQNPKQPQPASHPSWSHLISSSFMLPGAAGYLGVGQRFGQFHQHGNMEDLATKMSSSWWWWQIFGDFLPACS